MDKQSFTLYSAQQGHQLFSEAWKHVKAELMAGRRVVVKIEPETRSLEQNRFLWRCLTDIAEQVEWYGQKLSAEDWKAILTASQKKQRAVAGIDGGFVVLGQSTSKMTIAEMSELLELAMAFGTQQGVLFKDTDPAHKLSSV